MTARREFPVALTEMLLRFYGRGAERDFSQVWDVYSRRPYDPLLRDLMRISDFKDFTDPNDEVSFSFAATGWSVRLSMVGPYGVALEGPSEGPWHPVVDAEGGDLRRGLDLVEAGGFQLLDRQLLERTVPIWGEDITLYAALFVNDDRFPWV